MTQKIKCFSHGDLDGVVSNLLMCRYYNLLGYGHSTETCNVGSDIDGKVIAYINNGLEYNPTDIIIITDVCVSYEVALILNALPNQKILIDHHDTSQKMLGQKNPEGVDFPWAYIKEGDSATMLVYRYLAKQSSRDIILQVLEAYKPLVVVTDLWDTKSRECEEYLNWKTLIENTLAFYNALGSQNFKARFLLNPSIDLTEVEQAKVDTTMKIKENVMKYTRVLVRPISYRGVNAVYGVCFGGMYRSEVAEYAFQNNSDLLFIIVIDMNTQKGSLRRSRHTLAEGLDLTQIARHFDPQGGGHPFACGFGFDISDFAKVITSLLTADFPLEYKE